MKKIILVATVCTQLLIPSTLLAGESAKANRGQGDPFEIALALDLPGKKGWDTCEPFAIALHDRLTKAQNEATLIYYEWSSAGRVGGRHAFVAYRDSQGRYWGMDQQLEKPKRLFGSSTQQWAESFDPHVTVKVYWSQVGENSYELHASR